jgi:hypothetical protein
MRKGDEPEGIPLLVGSGGQPDRPLVLAAEKSDLSQDVEGVDGCGTPTVIREYLEGVLGD